MSFRQRVCRTFSRTARTNLHSSRAANCGTSVFFDITQHKFATTIQLIRSARELDMQGQGEQLTEHKTRNTPGLTCAKHAHTHISGEQCFRNGRVFGFDFGWSVMFSQEDVYDRFCNKRDARDGAATPGCDSPPSQTREKDQTSASNFASIFESCCFTRKMLKQEECCQHARHARGCGRMAVVVGASMSGGGSWSEEGLQEERCGRMHVGIAAIIVPCLRRVNCSTAHPAYGHAQRGAAQHVFCQVFVFLETTSLGQRPLCFLHVTRRVVCAHVCWMR